MPCTVWYGMVDAHTRAHPSCLRAQEMCLQPALSHVHVHGTHVRYPFLPPSEKPLECVTSAGEAMYFPTGWFHAVINLDETVFMASFHVDSSTLVPDKDQVHQKWTNTHFNQYTPPPKPPLSLSDTRTRDGARPHWRGTRMLDDSHRKTNRKPCMLRTSPVRAAKPLVLGSNTVTAHAHPEYARTHTTPAHTLSHMQSKWFCMLTLDFIPLAS